MAVWHFTSIPSEPNTVKRHAESYTFWESRRNTNNIVYARFVVFRTFRCVFMVFVRYELWVNVPFAIFFGTVD